MDDISSSYANGLFLVVLLDDKVIGTGAIIPEPKDAGEIVRMSVAANMRRKGIGKMILDKLYNYAKTCGYKQIILETTETWHEAIGFYKNYGFHITHYLDGDVYFSLKL